MGLAFEGGEPRCMQFMGLGVFCRMYQTIMGNGRCGEGVRIVKDMGPRSRKELCACTGLISAGSGSGELP